MGGGCRRGGVGVWGWVGGWVGGGQAAPGPPTAPWLYGWWGHPHTQPQGRMEASRVAEHVGQGHAGRAVHRPKARHMSIAQKPQPLCLHPCRPQSNEWLVYAPRRHALHHTASHARAHRIHQSPTLMPPNTSGQVLRGLEGRKKSKGAKGLRVLKGSGGRGAQGYAPKHFKTSALRGSGAQGAQGLRRLRGLKGPGGSKAQGDQGAQGAQGLRGLRGLRGSGCPSPSMFA